MRKCWWHVLARLASDDDHTGLRRVAVDPVAPALSDGLPAVSLQLADQVTVLHNS